MHIAIQAAFFVMDTEEVQHYSLNDIQFNTTVCVCSYIVAFRFVLTYAARQTGEIGVCGNRPEAAGLGLFRTSR